jgi:hypothetical protein
LCVLAVEPTSPVVVSALDGPRDVCIWPVHRQVWGKTSAAAVHQCGPDRV